MACGRLGQASIHSSQEPLVKQGHGQTIPQSAKVPQPWGPYPPLPHLPQPGTTKHQAADKTQPPLAKPGALCGAFSTEGPCHREAVGLVVPGECGKRRFRTEIKGARLSFITSGQWLSLGLSGKGSRLQRTGSAFPEGPGLVLPGSRPVSSEEEGIHVLQSLSGLHGWGQISGDLNATRCARG